MQESQRMQHDPSQLLDWLSHQGWREMVEHYPNDRSSLAALSMTALGVSLGAMSSYGGAGGLSSWGVPHAMVFQALSVSLCALGAARASRIALSSLRWPSLLNSKLELPSDTMPEWVSKAQSARSYLLGYTTDRGLPVRISKEHLSRHFMAAGMTGVGKTVSSTLLMAQQMSMGGGVLWVDGKLDPENMQMFFHLAKWMGRESDVRIIHPANPSSSNTYNFIAHGTPEQVASRILSTIPATQTNAGSDYYKQAANQGLMCLLGAIQWLGLSYNCMDLAILLTHPRALLELDQKINAQLQKGASQHEPSIASFKLFLESCKSTHPISGKVQMDTRKLKEVFGGVAGRLFVFGSGSSGEVTNTYHSEVNLFEAMKEGQLVYCALPTMGQHLSAQNFGKMLLGDLRQAIAGLQELPKLSRPDPPFLIWLDEVASYGNANALSTPFQQARSAHIALGVGFQEHASIEELGPSFLSTILGNTYNKLLFKPSDPKTTQAWAEMMGRHRVAEIQVAEQFSTSKVFDFLGWGLNPKVSQSHSKTFQTREREEYRLTVERLAKLDVGQAVLLHGATHLLDLRIPQLSFGPEMKRELGEVVIQRSWGQLKAQSQGPQEGTAVTQATSQALDLKAQWRATFAKSSRTEEERGLFFYQKYQPFLSELATDSVRAYNKREPELGSGSGLGPGLTSSSQHLQPSDDSTEMERRRKFQKLGSLRPEV